MSFNSRRLSLRRFLLIWLPAIAIFLPGVNASAACSRPVTLAYATEQIAAEYVARPEQQLPSLQAALAERSGCEVNVLSYPTARVMKMYADGELDIVIGVAQTTERDAIGSFIADKSGGWVLMTTLPAGTVPERLEDFASHRDLLVGILRGAVFPPPVNAVIDVLRQQGQIDEFRDFGMGMDKMGFKRNAAIFTTDTSSALVPRKAGDNSLRIITQPQFPDTLGGFYLSRKSLNAADLELLSRVMSSPGFRKLDDELRRTRLLELGILEKPDQSLLTHPERATRLNKP